jgi:transcriptional regulator with XRE-family HTH domain
MNQKRKVEIRKLFGLYLKNRRENILKIKSVRQLSFNSNIDHSKLSKIEKGLIDIRFDTLVEIAKTYEIDFDKLFDFKIPFWNEE